MKKAFSSVIIMLLLLLVSCDKNKEIKQFATDFTIAAKSGYKSEIIKMYPDAVVADSLNFTFDAEKAEIEEIEDKGWKLTLGNNQFVIIERTEDDGPGRGRGQGQRGRPGGRQSRCPEGSHHQADESPKSYP